MTENIPTYPDLAGKVAVVTGGSGDIGAATCRLLAANGMKVAVNGRDKARIGAVVDEICSEGGQAIAVAADVTDYAAIERMRGQVEQELGPVEVLATFAGSGGPPPGPTAQITEALKKLEESGENEETRRRHALFFLALAERAEPELKGPNQVEWLDQLDREHSNLRSAIGWALSTGDAEAAARLGSALWMFWWYRGHQREGRRLAEAVLVQSALSPALRARALMVAGSLAYAHGDHEQCERYCGECLELSQQVDDKLPAAFAHLGLGVAAMSRTDYETATFRLREAFRSFREVDEDFGASQAITFLGILALMRGDVGQARPMFEEGLALARRKGDRTGSFIALYNLAQVTLSGGDHDRAATLFEEGVTLPEQVGDRANVAYCLEGLAVVANSRGEAERSARLIGAAEGLHEAVGVPVYVYYEPHRSMYERTVAAVRSQMDEEVFQAAWAEGREMTFEQAVAYALEREEPSPT